MTGGEELRIVPACAEDAPLLLELIGELALAEKFPDELTVSEEDLVQHLFGEEPAAEALLGYLGPEPVSFAVFYSTFATSTGKPGLHLDDLYVRPKAQGKGVGRKMLCHLAGLARERGCARFEWWALEWNEEAIAFYEKVGARDLGHLRVFRLAGEALDEAARPG